MNTETARHVATLAAMLARIPYALSERGPGGCAADAAALNTLATRATTNAVYLCNVGGQDRYEKRQASVKRKAAEILEPYGLRASVGGDPRGSCLKIKTAEEWTDRRAAPEHYQPFTGEDGFRL